MVKIEQIRTRKIKSEFVPVVGPNGEFSMPKCIRYENKDGGHNTIGGLRPVVWSDAIGDFVVHRDFQGWTLYKDICRDEPQYYEDWEKVAAQVEAGAHITNLPDDFYHPEVYKRRKGHMRGKPIMDISEILGKRKGRPKKEE